MTAIPHNLLLHEILEEQARRSRENVALEFHPDVKMTYEELNHEANRLARYLEKRKPHSSEVVALCLEKSPRLVVAVVAILKAGMAWVPIPMEAPPARISSILGACGAGFALCTEPTRHVVEDLTSLIVLDDLLHDAEFLACPDTNLACDRNASDLCEILFTSGSTGAPKGVALEHQAMMHCVWAMVEEFGLTAKTRTLQFSAPTFDAFSLDVFMSIACGGCLVMAPPSTMLADMTAFIRNHGVTYAHLTPTVLELIDPLGVPDFETLSSTGEALSENLADRWRTRLRLFNSYGPTETLVCTIQYLGDDRIDASCIGQAVQGLDVCLLAPGELHEVARGDVGEICVAGPHLFRGYVSEEKPPARKPQMSQCFRNGTRYYRTGDMGKMESCPGGGYTLRYLGRRDSQVKIHGIRTDLGDVERSILTCEPLKNCIAILPRSGPSQGRLCCIVTLHQYSTAEADSEPGKAHYMGDSVELLNVCDDVASALNKSRDAAAARLPTHQLPTSWWPVKEFPRTSSGKVDRVKLRSLLESMENKAYTQHLNSFLGTAKVQSGPSDIVERQLRSLWADVLDRPMSAIDATVSFAHLGADSLDVIRLVSKARAKGMDVSIPQVYASKTVQQLARVQQPHLRHQTAAQRPVYRPFTGIPVDRPLGILMQNAATACQVGVEEIEDIFGTTQYQAGLMSADLRSPGTYICAFSWTLRKNMDVAKFRSSWEALLANEPVLRSRLIWDESRDGLWQVVVRPKGPTWSEEYFEAPMSLGDDLCRGFVKWHPESQAWRFFLKIHHSINDGWSLRLILNRLRAVYLGEDAGPPPRLHFAEFMYYRTEEENSKQEASSVFWGSYLEGCAQLDFPPAPSESHHEVHATGHQSCQITGLFRETAASFGVTPATLLYAAVALLLAVNADSEDVTFGLILAGRESPLEGVFDMIGPTFASFPLRVRVDGRMTIKSLLQLIQDHIVNIIPHQHYGLQRIRQCGNGAARASDFRCLVIVQPEDESSGGQGLWHEVHGQTSGRADSIPMTLELVLDSDKILVNCNFDSAFLSPQDVGVLLGQLGHVLKHLEKSTSRTDILVSQVRFEGQEAQLPFLDWAKRHGASVDSCLHELFFDSLEQHPDRVAIDDQGTHRQMTYQELDACSDRLCSHIQSQHSFVPETMIPVMLSKSPLAIITILAVLKAGGAYVPVDPSWPIRRVRHIVKETKASILLLCCPGVSTMYREGMDTTVVMDLTEYSWEKKPLRAGVDGEEEGCKHKVGEAVSSTNLACVLYTSGSTGLPKGAMLEHRALSTSLAHLTRVFAMKPGTRHLQFSSFVFDLSMADVFVPLLSGACICIPTEQNRINRLSSTVREMAIESALLTPSLADLILPSDAASLKTLATAGEMMRPSLIRRWSQRVRLLNAYGLIETSILTSVSDPLSLDASASNIGRNVTAWHWIVRKDSTGAIRSVPKGCIGEIAVAGHVLARGYLNNPALTEKHFVDAPNLAAGLTTSRVYLTGDVGKYRADGSICLLGRNDQMVKVNGIRVEPGESEHQLQQQGGIFASCVVRWVQLHDEQSSARLAAFVPVGSSDSGDSTASKIIAVEKATTPAFQERCCRAQLRLQELLPVQHVPTLFIPIRAIPYTTSGKVDLELLKAELQKLSGVSELFGLNQGTEQSKGELPVTASEIALESSFRHIFGDKQRYHTGVSFFALGGESLSSIRLVNAARKHGWEISVEQVHRHPRLGDLAAVATPAQKHHKPLPAFSMVRNAGFDDAISSAADKCGLKAAQVVDLYPCTAMQEALMIASAKSSGSFFNQQVFQLADETSFATLDTALQSVWARHAILRTRIVLDHEYRSLQVVVEERLEIGLAENQPVDEYLARDLALVPRYGDKLSRCAMLSCTSGRFLVISQHHAVYDGWSMRLMLADIEHHYLATRISREPPAFSSFIHHVTELRKAPGAQNYWRQHLRGASVTTLPQIKIGANFEANQKHSTEVQLPVHDRHSLATVAEAAWGLLLCRYTGREEVTFGCVRAGRSAPVANIDSIVGPTIVTIPRRIFAPRSQQVGSYLETVEAAMLDSLPWEQLGHQNIRKLSSDAHNACRFSSLLVVQPVPSVPDTAASKILIPQRSGDGLFKDDCLTLECQPRGDRLSIQVMYDDRAIAREEVAWMSHNFARLLSELSSRPRQTVAELDAVGPRGTKQVQMWNGSVPMPTPTRVDGIFTERARDWPSLTAVSASDALLTYAELEKLSSRLATGLGALRVGRGSTVPLLMSKSGVAVVCMLAILKAGAAYAPIAPDLAKSQLGLLRDRLDVSIVLCTPDQASKLADQPIKVVCLTIEHLVREEFPALPLIQDVCKPERAFDMPQAAIQPDLAYVGFTSDDHGKPKGILLDNNALSTAIQSVSLRMEHVKATRTLSFFPHTAYINVLEIWLALFHGACLFLPTDEQRTQDLCGYMNENKIQLAFLTPTITKNVLLAPTRVPTLKALYTAGEPIPQPLLERWSPAVRLISLYGFAETFAHAAMNEHVTTSTDASNIGYPLASHVWVVDADDHSRLVPVGCRGELLISGPALACGYLSSDGTAQATAIDGSQFPWTLPGEGRFFATGDIVRQNPDGSINYISNKGQDPRLNGLPFQPSEIENEVERCEGVVSAMVEKYSQPETLSEFLVVFFTVAATTKMGQRCKRLDTTDAIQLIVQTASTRVSERIPPNIAPLFYLPICAPPLAASGRVDRGALRCIFDQASHDRMAMYRPRKPRPRETRTGIERTLQRLWAQIWSLDPSQIDLDSQFLALGGDSLTAIKLATMCRKVGYKLEVADILRNPKFEDLAILVQRGQESAPDMLPRQEENTWQSTTNNESLHPTSKALSQAATICQVDASQIEDIYPCTPTMEALIAATARTPDAYIARESFLIPRGVDLQRFCSAWDLVARSNPIMRTRICSILTDGEFKSMQVVCSLPRERNESANSEAFNDAMTMGTSLFRYRIRDSREGPIFEVLKHHAVFDGYASAMLWEDFKYAFEYSQPPPPRPPFKNYVSYIKAQDEEEAIKFWTKSTGDFHGEHFPALPCSQYTPATCASLGIETPLTWTNTCQFTFATVVRAAWAIVLSMRSRLSGQTKNTCFAVTTSGRGASVAGIDKVAGPTITTVPVVVELDMNQPIAEYLSQMHEQALSTLPYEYYGLGQVQKVSAAAREASRTPNLLVVQPSHLEDDEFPLGLTRVLDNQEAMIDCFGLVTECWRNHRTRTISLSASYDAMLMQKQQVHGMLQQLSWLIARLNENSSSLSTIQSTIWSLAEEHEFSRLQDWNETPQCSTESCLHELFEASVGLQPHDLAVEAHDGSLTYAELNTAAIAVKEALVGNYGIGPGDLVPLCLDKSVLMIVAIMGVLKAGAGYVPLDTSHPSSRLKFIIQEVQAKVVIVSKLQHNTRRYPAQTLVLESEFPFIAPTSAQTPQETRLATPKDVAYVIFTSGSTGKPKGVVMEHGAASLSILEHGKRYRHDQRGNKTRALQFSSYTFDASVLDIFAVLAYGGCVCVPSEQDRMGNLEEILVKMSINFVDLTPTVARILDPAAVPALTALTLAGEMADEALIEQWRRREPPLEVFVNSYGPTEAAISCAVGEISPEKPAGHVGKRLGGYLWIVDEEDHEHLMPIGCVGELVVSGPTLARGYLGDADKTSAAFIRNVHWIADQKYDVLYKTGDLARFDFEGNVEILGRKDDGQVKLNGLRIELGEIENSIKSCPQFSDARQVAVAKVSNSGNNILAAFLHLPGCQAISPDSCLARPSKTFKQAVSEASHHLQADLPRYMIPTLWIPTSSWPLNAAGKTDRKGLVSATEAQTPANLMQYLRTANAACDNSDPIDAKTEAEKLLEDAWNKVLNREDGAAFELQDDFFAVGGDSLTTIMLISLLKTKGIRVTAQDIFGTKTLRNMASKVYSKNTQHVWTRDDSMPRNQSMSNRQQGPMTTPACTTDARNVGEVLPALAIEAQVEQIYPASHMQLSYLVEGQKRCRSYYCWFFIDVGESPVLKVQEACAAVALRHQILRTSFHLTGRGCHQVVRNLAPNFKVLFSSFSPADWGRQLDKDVAHPVCFGEVLTRFRLLMDVETGRRALAVGLSHAQYDGFCTPTILNDLSLAYAGKDWQSPSPPRFKDFIKHTTDLCNDEADHFWREKLRGSTLTSIVKPLGCNARPVMSRSSKHAIPFEFKHRGSISYPVMLKVAWATALSQISQSSDITFGNLVSGRYAAFEGAQEVVGPCLNVIPFRMRIDAGQNFRLLLKAAHDQSIDTIPFEATPFDRIAAQAPWPAAAWFSSIFQFQNIPGRAGQDRLLAGSGWKTLGSAVYGGGLLQSGACWLTAWPATDGTARFLLRYSDETMGASEAEAAMDLFLGVLRLVNDDPGASVASASGPSPSAKTTQSRLPVRPQPRDPSSSSQSRALTPALMPIIEELKSIWRSVLHFHGEIHPEDSFFDVGGDSIAAARLASACVKMGLGLSVQDIIDFPSLLSQVDCITGRDKNTCRPGGEPGLVYEDSYEFI